MNCYPICAHHMEARISSKKIARRSIFTAMHQQLSLSFVFFGYSKWKADRASVTSLCVSPDGKLLLSAGQIIKMWDLETKEVYRVSVLFEDLYSCLF